MNNQSQNRLRIIWLILGLYIVIFVSFAAFDLYAEHTTQGLFNTHRTPFMHTYGNVVDPKPKQTMKQEVSARLQVPISTLPIDLFGKTQLAAGYVREAAIRMPRTDEILLGKVRDGGSLLVLGQYRGEWVTFRPLLGVVIEPINPMSSLNAGLIMKVPAP